MAADFKELMSKKVDETKRPKPLPAGLYEGIVLSYKPDERTYRQGEDPTPVLAITIQLSSPADDGIDEEDLREEDGSPINLSSRRQRYDFNFQAENLWRLKEFLESCGVETEGRSFGETLPDIVNAPVLVTLNNKPGKEEGEVYVNVIKLTGTANAE